MESLTVKQKTWLIGTAIFGVALLILFLFMVRIVTIEGNQIGVKETWSEGVVDEPMQPGTYILIPGWSQRVYPYDVSTQVFVMNDKKEEKANGESVYQGRDEDAYHVQSAEGQDMTISLNVQWRIDPAKVVEIHKNVRNNVEEKIIRTVVMRVVKDEATTRKAVDAYSGEGLVKLQNDIHRDLSNPNGELSKRGIIVDNFVIEGIQLDEKYIGEIRARQVATQKKSRAEEETKAAEAEALKAKAEAQADFNKRVVEAERDKEVAILKAEQEAKAQVLAAKADAEKVELAANADKKKIVLAAEGEKEAGILKALSIEAIGKAEAEATKLKLTAYAVPGSDNFTRIEVAKSMSQGFSNIRGYLPSNMSVNVLSENFTRAVENFLGSPSAKK